jgi:general secretion pathway protein N
MRIRLPLGRWLVLAVAFLAMLVMSTPLRVALDELGFDERGLGARSVTGNLWSGELTEARFRGIALGDLDAGLSPLALLVGEARMTLASPAWRATLVQAGSDVGVTGLSGRLGPEALAASLPVSAIEFDAADIRFRDGVCATAAGMVRLEPRTTVPGTATLGQLGGTLRCDGEAVLASLLSGSGRERVDLRLFGDGRYSLTLVVTADDPAVAAALTGNGFVATTDGLTMTTEGSF